MKPGQLLAASTIALTTTLTISGTALSNPIGPQVSLGYRGHLGDPSSLVIGYHGYLGHLGAAQLISVTEAYLGGPIELRQSIQLSDPSIGLSPTMAIGLAYNVDNLGNIDPLISLGIQLIPYNYGVRGDLGNLAAYAKINQIFQPNDVDTELVIGITLGLQ